MKTILILMFAVSILNYKFEFIRNLYEDSLVTILVVFVVVLGMFDDLQWKMVLFSKDIDHYLPIDHLISTYVLWLKLSLYYFLINLLVEMTMVSLIRNVSLHTLISYFYTKNKKTLPDKIKTIVMSPIALMASFTAQVIVYL